MRDPVRLRRPARAVKDLTAARIWGIVGELAAGLSTQLKTSQILYKLRRCPGVPASLPTRSTSFRPAKSMDEKADFLSAAI
jgi:hypothetical protein